MPLIRAGNDFYAVTAGVWFTAPQVTGPWRVATSVPAVIYTIPASSPLHYVTYVRIYEATPSVVYVGYTPGYLGTVVSPYGTVVYGTGYVYNPWIGSVWYAPPYTYGVAAAPVYNPYVGFTYGFAVGLATAAWMEPYWGGAYYHPGYWGGYGCCVSASANVYGHWGSTTYSGTRRWYAGGGVAGTPASGTYDHTRTGTSGTSTPPSQRLDQQRHRGYDHTPAPPPAARQHRTRQQHNVYSQLAGSAVSGTPPAVAATTRAGASTTGPWAAAHVSGGTSTNAAAAGSTWGTASVGPTSTTPTSATFTT